MPLLVQKMAESLNDELIFEAHTPGGTTISMHANSEELENKINSKNWDYVTIQGQSSEPALSQEYFDNEVKLTVFNNLNSWFFN